MSSRNRRGGRGGANAGRQQGAAVRTLECPVCYEEFDKENRNPMVFPCGHTLCKRCLTSLPRDARNVVSCTTCREDFYFSRIPKNFALEEALDLLQAQAAQQQSNSARTVANLRVDGELMKNLVEQVRMAVMQGAQNLEETKKATQKVETLGRTVDNFQLLRDEVNERIYYFAADLNGAINEFNSRNGPKFPILFCKYVLYPIILYTIYKLFLKEQQAPVDSFVHYQMIHPGAVIFFGKNKSDFCQAVEKVVSDNDFFHVAIVSDIGTIVEAQPAGVIEYQTLIESIKENEPGYLEIVNPAKSEAEKLKAATWARTKVGLGYNDLFAADLLNSEGKESYYCSQLITEAFRESDMKWPSHTLNFEDEKGELIEFWKEYFEKRGGRQVPQGDAGSHPAQLRKSPVFLITARILPNAADLKPPKNMKRLENPEFLKLAGSEFTESAQTTQSEWVVFVNE